MRLPILLVVSCTGKMNIFLYPLAPENLVSRDRLRPSRPASACSFLHTRAESGAYLGIPADFYGGGVHLFI